MLCNYNSTDAHICAMLHSVVVRTLEAVIYFYHYSCAHIMPMAVCRHAFQPYKIHDDDLAEIVSRLQKLTAKNMQKALRSCSMRRLFLCSLSL